MKPIVAIVGRPNVGKSTLFNRLTQSRTAIVEAEPGVTRDRLYGDAEWLGRVFALVDTGGIESTEDTIKAGTRRQAELAMTEADLILFVVDAREGITPPDEEVADLLRRADKPVLLVANKVDNIRIEHEQTGELYGLGFGDPISVSSVHGLGTGDLLDRIIEKIQPVLAEEEEETDEIKIAFVGRPNVGKSSLVNYLLGQERMIVSDVPGTTRDAIDTVLERGGRRFRLIDTAGMRRKARIDDPVERYSVMRAIRAIDRCDLAFVVLDGTQGLTDQDKRIAGMVGDAGKGMAFVINKWDITEKDERTAADFSEDLKLFLPTVAFAPTLYTSAKTGQRVQKLLDLATAIATERNKRVNERDLNDLMRESQLLNPPPTVQGRRLKIFYATQDGTRPPTFALTVNDPMLAVESYRRYIEHRLREAYGFEGTPIRLFLREKK
ncbi:MAG: ribosome biogenesis GTPase Der [Chloroflexota bacterium]